MIKNKPEMPDALKPCANCGQTADRCKYNVLCLSSGVRADTAPAANSRVLDIGQVIRDIVQKSTVEDITMGSSETYIKIFNAGIRYGIESFAALSVNPARVDDTKDSEELKSLIADYMQFENEQDIPTYMYGYLAKWTHKYIKENGRKFPAPAQKETP